MPSLCFKIDPNSRKIQGFGDFIKKICSPKIKILFYSFQSCTFLTVDWQLSINFWQSIDNRLTVDWQLIDNWLSISDSWLTVDWQLIDNWLSVFNQLSTKCGASSFIETIISVFMSDTEKSPKLSNPRILQGSVQ